VAGERKVSLSLSFTTTSKPALKPTQYPIKWVLGAFSAGLKQPGSEADHTPPSSAKVKNARSYTSTPSRCDAYLSIRTTSLSPFRSCL
jgi:hypothetical protein